MTKAILFDYGGTLDSEGWHWSSQFFQAITKYLPNLERKVVDRAFLQADGELYNEPEVVSFGLFAHIKRHWEIMASILGLSAKMLEKTSLDVFQQQMKCIKKNREFLSSLSSTYKLGLISNFTANLPIILQETKLDTLFDATLISKVDDLKKPLKAAFYLLTDRLQVKPKNCAMVGDSYKNDIVPAKSLGMTTYWLGSDDCVKTEESDAADYRITRLEDFN